MPSFQTGKLQPREVRYIAQGQPGEGKTWDWTQKSGSKACPLDYVHCLNEWMVNLQQAPRWTGGTEALISQSLSKAMTKTRMSQPPVRLGSTLDVLVAREGPSHSGWSQIRQGQRTWQKWDPGGGDGGREGNTNSAAFPHRRIHKCQCSSRSIY